MSRADEVARLRRIVERVHSPRLHMFLIVSLTAAFGFLASFLMLHGGLDSMWLRYPLAVLVAYIGFLFLLWVWLRLRESEVFDCLDVPSLSDGPSLDVETFNAGGGHFGGGGHSGTFETPASVDASSSIGESSGSGGNSIVSDVAGGIDLEELTIVIVAIIALIGSLWAALSIVSAAPTLFAELLLDGALATGLYRRLRRAEGNYWLSTAVRRTVWRFVGVAVLFCLLGAVMQAVVPGARSIGQVMQ